MPLAPSSESYQRTIDVFLSPESEGAQRAVASITDPVHNMELIARVQPNGTLTNACVADRSHPFDECRQAIAKSGEIWDKTNLRNEATIRATRDLLEGCTHISELIQYLAFAFQRELKHTRLELDAVLGNTPLNVDLRLTTNNSVSGRLQIEMPVTGSGYSIQAGAARIIDTDDSLSRLLKKKSPEEGLRALRSNGHIPETEVARLLLRFYRQTARAILTPRRVDLHSLRGAIRFGRVSPVDCALFKDLIHPSHEG